MFIAKFIEDVVLELATSPHPKSVVFCIKGILDSLVVDFLILLGPWHKHIWRNIISSFYVDRPSIHLHIEGFALLVWISLLYPLDFSNACSYRFRIKLLIVLHEDDFEVV